MRRFGKSGHSVGYIVIYRDCAMSMHIGMLFSNFVIGKAFITVISY